MKHIPTEGTRYDNSTVTHRVSIAILDIDFCPMGDQQVDDLAVVVLGCQHQAGHLRPEKETRQESREDMNIKDNKREGMKRKQRPEER